MQLLFIIETHNVYRDKTIFKVKSFLLKNNKGLIKKQTVRFGKVKIHVIITSINIYSHINSAEKPFYTKS